MNKKLLFSLTGSLLLGVTSCEVSDFISDTFGSEEKKLPEEVADATPGHRKISWEEQLQLLFL